MWTMFGDLLKLKTSHRVDPIFRIVGYGTILLLLCFADVVVNMSAVGTFFWWLERIVITTSLAGVLVFLWLRWLQPRGAFPVQSLSPDSRRSVRAVSIVSSICFLLLIGVAYCGDLLGAEPMFGSIFLSLPLSLPLLLILAFLTGGQLKRGLALAVAMYSTLLLVSIWILSISRAWEDPWWIQLAPSLAALASLIATSMAVWSYYTLPRETYDLRKLLGAFSYPTVLLFLFGGFVDFTGEGDRQTIHAQMARMKLIEINEATSVYATHFGGLFPENLDALGPPAKNQKADCRAAGLLHKPFTTNSGGYIFEYRIGLPSRTAPGGCEGVMHYNITARPAVYEKTGHINLYTDDSGVVRCTYGDRPANAQDRKCGNFFANPHWD